MPVEDHAERDHVAGTILEQSVRVRDARWQIEQVPYRQIHPGKGRCRLGLV